MRLDVLHCCRLKKAIIENRISVISLNQNYGIRFCRPIASQPQISATNREGVCALTKLKLSSNRLRKAFHFTFQDSGPRDPENLRKYFASIFRAQRLNQKDKWAYKSKLFFFSSILMDLQFVLQHAICSAALSVKVDLFPFFILYHPCFSNRILYSLKNSLFLNTASSG